MTDEDDVPVAISPKFARALASPRAGHHVKFWNEAKAMAKKKEAEAQTQKMDRYRTGLIFQLYRVGVLILTLFLLICFCYCLNTTLLVIFGVLGLVLPVGIIVLGAVAFGTLAIKEIWDVCTLLKVSSMLDSSSDFSNLNLANPFGGPSCEDLVNLSSSAQFISPCKKKVRFVDSPAAEPPRRVRRSNSAPPELFSFLNPKLAGQAEQEAEIKAAPPADSFLAMLLSFIGSHDSIDADEMLSGAWGTK